MLATDHLLQRESPRSRASSLHTAAVRRHSAFLRGLITLLKYSVAFLAVLSRCSVTFSEKTDETFYDCVIVYSVLISDSIASGGLPEEHL